MAKAKTTAFFCKECGYESSKWMGQCPACKAWNSMVEEPVSKSAGSQGGLGRLSSGVTSWLPSPARGKTLKVISNASLPGSRSTRLFE